MIEISPAGRYSPAGECLRLAIMRRLMEGPARVEELDELAKEAVERIGVRYDWRVWPELLAREVVVEDTGGGYTLRPLKLSGNSYRGFP